MSNYEIKRQYTSFMGNTVYVLNNGNTIAQGSSVSLYGADYDGRLVTEYTDSGKEIYAAQHYDFNVYITSVNRSWITPYSNSKLKNELCKDDKLNRYTVVEEFEI